MVTAIEIAWAAGFFDGEGHIDFQGPKIGASQNDPELLQRLVAMFGGTITSVRNGGCHRWTLCGSRGIGVVMTLYPFLSAKRRTEVRRVIAMWRALPGHRRGLGPLRHGTLYGYTGHGCRCGPCRLEHASYRRAVKAGVRRWEVRRAAKAAAAA